MPELLFDKAEKIATGDKINKTAMLLSLKGWEEGGERKKEGGWKKSGSQQAEHGPWQRKDRDRTY